MNNSSGNALDNNATNNLPPAKGPLPYGYTPAVARDFDTHPVPEAIGRGRVVRADRNLQEARRFSLPRAHAA